MPTLEEFRRRMAVLGDRVVENAGRVVQKTALELDRRLVLATPVDEGRARSNWLVGINGANRNVRDTPIPEGAAIAAAASAIAAARPGDAIFLSNNLPYIGPLSRGSSLQARAGWIDGIVAQAPAILRRFRLVEG